MTPDKSRRDVRRPGSTPPTTNQVVVGHRLPLRELLGAYAEGPTPRPRPDLRVP